jgi:hypothetical protein
MSLFFCLRKLWLKHGDHTVIGNPKKVNITNSFVNQQCFLDLQMFCHFVVFFINHFRDQYPELVVSICAMGRQYITTKLKHIFSLQTFR